MSSGTVTIYVLVDSRESDPVRRVRYVGRTVTSLERRLRGHTQTINEQTMRACWMRSVVAAGAQVVIEPVGRVDLCYGDEAEIAAIAYYRRLGCKLMNHTDGGGGILNPSLETRARIGAAKKGHKFWIGKKHTEEAKRKIAAARLGKSNPRMREVASRPEVRAKIAATLRAKVLTPEQLTKKREHMYRVVLSPAGRAKQRASVATPEHRALLKQRANQPSSIERLRQLGLRNKGRVMSQAVKDACAARSRGRRHTVQTKAKMSAWQQGGKSHRAKLTQSDVDAIRARHSEGGISQHALARAYKVQPRTINLIVHYKTWAA